MLPLGQCFIENPNKVTILQQSLRINDNSVLLTFSQCFCCVVRKQFVCCLTDNSFDIKDYKGHIFVLDKDAWCIKCPERLSFPIYIYNFHAANIYTIIR